MTKEQLLGEAGSLSSRDRLELAMELWDSVEADAEFPSLSEHQLGELNHRLDAYLPLAEIYAGVDLPGPPKDQ